MALPIYLALTDWEYRYCRQLPEHIGWMACNFSSCNEGLANIPLQLPEGSLLLLSDQLPPQGHDPNTVAQQLRSAAENLKLSGVMLDFQRPYSEETANMVMHIQNALTCPAAVTATYCHDWHGAVCLPPVPVDEAMEEYLNPYAGRQIWLEIENSGEELVLTADGCHRQPLSHGLQQTIFEDARLCCHYSIRVFQDKAVFSLQRSPEDIRHLLEKAQAFGVSLAVGLYQEFG